MLSHNIRDYRKKSNMSQDELAEKLGVSRQSISLWETGQTQPTIDNIIALAKIFGISTDMLLGTSGSINASQDKAPEKKRNTESIITLMIVIALIVCVVIMAVSLWGSRNQDDADTEPGNSVVDAGTEPGNSVVDAGTEPGNSVVDAGTEPGNSVVDVGTEPSNSAGDAEFDLFSYCKSFAIEKGRLNGDYCIYQQPAAKYGGYDNEYFSISYWSGSDMVEFCLHCPLSETYSVNFYLRMRGGYDKKYEYLSSKYFRDTGESLRSAAGYIDPAVFSDNYPISWDEYEGSLDGQDEFMEATRVGICDLIHCLKEFVKVENMECDFSVFDFIHF